jgi:hypothetical protein
MSDLAAFYGASRTVGVTCYAACAALAAVEGGPGRVAGDRTGVKHPRQAAANRSGEWEKQYCDGLTLMRPAGRRNRQSCGCISSCASPSGDSR